MSDTKIKADLLKDEMNLDITSTHILDNISDGIIILELGGKLLFINKKLEELLGYSFNELVGVSNREAIKTLLGKSLYNEIRKSSDMLKSGTSVINRRNFRHKSGQLIPLEVRAFPVYGKNGQIAGELLTLKDLHEELLVTVTKLVNSSLSLQDVLQNTTTAIVEHLGLDSNAIFLLNEDKNELQLISCNVFNKEQLDKVVIKVGEGAPGIIAATAQPLYVSNLKTDETIDPYSRKIHKDKSSIGYPLICKDMLLGVIAFDAHIVREFTAKEKEIFQNIANQVALAIYNAQLFSKLHHLSTTDGLTGLYNHRYFQERLSDEIERSKRNGGKLSLLMLDVDKFKNYNDAFGHLQGDKLLKKIALLIHQNVRSFDITARYGGEEFAVILLDCAIEEASVIAERIRKAIEINNITISIGLTEFYSFYEKETMINFADKALYQAKKNGRNMVVVWKE